MNRIIFLLFLFILTACAKKEDKELTDAQRNSFFDIVYKTVSIRPIGSSTWLPIGGEQELFLKVTTDLSNDEVSTEQEGEYSISYKSYSPSINNISPCQGGYEGKFEVTSVESATIDRDDPDSDYYDVFDNYGNGSLSDENLEIKIYKFVLMEKNRSLYPENTCPNLQNTFYLDIIRFTNGELIVEDESQGFEYLMQPKKK